MIVAIGLLCAGMGCTGSLPHPGSFGLRSEKQGRVVDASSGIGLPGVNVIAVWNTASSGVAGMVASRNYCNAQRMVITDSEGRFTLPSVYRDVEGMEGGLLNAISRERLLVVFKPGYVRPGDLEILPKHENEFFAWQVFPPESREQRMGKVDLHRIALVKVDLEAPDVWVYDSAVLFGARCLSARGQSLEDPEFQNLKLTLRAAVRPMPCALPRQTVIPAHAWASFGWVLNDNAFFARMKVLEPWDHETLRSTTAGKMCQALDETSAP